MGAESVCEGDEAPLPTPRQPARRAQPQPQTSKAKGAATPSVASSKKRTAPSPAPASQEQQAPKRAATAFACFARGRRDALPSQGTAAELERLLIAEWKALQPADRKPYEEEEARDRIRYAEEVATLRMQRASPGAGCDLEPGSGQGQMSTSVSK